MRCCAMGKLDAVFHRPPGPAVFLDGDSAAGAKVFQALITASSVSLRLLPTRLPPARVEQVQRRDNGLHEHPDALGKRVRHEGS